MEDPFFDEYLVKNDDILNFFHYKAGDSREIKRLYRVCQVVDGHNISAIFDSVKRKLAIFIDGKHVK